MLYEVIKAATGLEVGETYSAEDLAKKGDVNNMVRKGIVCPVGFLSMGAPMSDSDAAKQIAELQKKIEALEDERDQARSEAKETGRKLSALIEGHKEGSRQLEAVTRERDNLRAELDKLKSPANKSQVA